MKIKQLLIREFLPLLLIIFSCDHGHDQTVYQAGRVEGVLRLSVPPVNLGYDEAYMGGSKPGIGEAESTLMGR